MRRIQVVVSERRPLGGKEVTGVEIIVTEVFPCFAVETIGSRLRPQVNYGGVTTAELAREVLRLDLRFFHHF